MRKSYMPQAEAADMQISFKSSGFKEFVSRRQDLAAKMTVLFKIAAAVLLENKKSACFKGD